MYTLKKSLGQHFLNDSNIIHQIINALKENPFDQLLEVGPGGGALTAELMKIPNVHFKAVELDQEKIDYLSKKYPELKDKMLHESFLSMDIPFSSPFHIIGNFPYNISTQIIFKILDWKELVPIVIGMFQKEVAERAAAKEGSKTYGVLSVLLQYYYDVEYLFSVSKNAFVPPPKVESGVIRMTRKADLLPVKSEKLFRTLVKTSFNQRRKMLRNGVKGLFSPEELKDPFFDRRAETLSIAEFAELTFKML